MKGAAALLLVVFFCRYAAAVEHLCSERETMFYLEDMLSRDISSVVHLEQGACQIKFSDGRYYNIYHFLAIFKHSPSLQRVVFFWDRIFKLLRTPSPQTLILCEVIGKYVVFCGWRTLPVMVNTQTIWQLFGSVFLNNLWGLETETDKYRPAGLHSVVKFIL